LILGISFPAENAFAITETQKITASDVAAGDQFGYSVAISGNTAIVGKPTGGSSSGSAYIFEFVDSSWTQTAKLTSSDAGDGGAFGASVAISGDTVIVGDRGADGLFGSGAAYIFEKPISGWTTATETAKLTASDGAMGDQVGASVSISGDTAIVGAGNDDDAGEDSGSAYIFVKPMSGWIDATQTAKLTASDGASQDLFGSSVAISGDTAIVGAWKDGVGKGSAYIFVKPMSGWIDATQTAKLTASDGISFDLFGLSVAISGDTAIVGSPFGDGADFDTGSAYIFVKPMSGWTTTTETAELTASDGAVNNVFGSVSISGDTTIVGAEGDAALSQFGAAYIFEKPISGWTTTTETTKLTASDGALGDRFGSSVGISSSAIVGAPLKDDLGSSDSGCAYIFNLSTSDEGGTCAVPEDGDDDFDGVPNSTDNCPSDSNPSQLDMDDDGTGDACDLENRITSDVTLTQSTTSLGDVIVQGGAVLTVNAGVNLDIDFTSNNLFVTSGSGVLVKAGASIS